ncbi:S-layer homology domain-containing protein [Paenibacillus sp. DXFW5]|uniref:S-layer homology domain-containing protein n=1 Tax=Paenibacillus rhizolycopersici TaxID=2780073 RepID=A0ABS2H5U5_9BACL|nr:S-layer homology domain-containing protein [Paenibacillus rhizolycopersici]MBM6996166.1 S-layer homology domain-containing protein [Paenibacillus rhizolycopersici]
MDHSWSFVIDFTLLSLLMVVSAILKARIPLLRKIIVPTSMVAGILGLIVGPELLDWLRFDIDRLGQLVYHLMAIGFIALSLKEREVSNSPAVMKSGMLIVSTYLIQGLVGFGLFLLLTEFFYPGMFPGIGLLLPLGYGQGPGQAYSIGSRWEALGLEGGGNLGLTIAGFGFIWAVIPGIILMNYLIRHPKYKQNAFHSRKERTEVTEKSEEGEIPLSDAIDKLTYQIALIGFIYLVTYLTIRGLEAVLTPLGTYGETLAQLLIGFHFLIGSLYAMLFRWILNRWKRAGFQLEHSPNNYLLQRISGFSFDYMIAASIAAISIYSLKQYLTPVLILTTVGGLITVWFMVWLVPRVLPEDKLPNILGFYGMLTGTISTGLALVKAVDPKFQSNTTDNLVMGSATAIMFGFPLLLILNIPIVGYLQQQPVMYLYTFAALFLYFAVLLGILLYRSRKTSA